MRVLITGASGFIGSNMLPKLVDHEVHVLERYVTGRYGKLERELITHFLDLTDLNGVRQLILRIRPEIVIHLAAISPVAYSYDHPAEVLTADLLATANLAEACAAVEGFKHMIVAGTTEEYGVNPQRPANEETECIPNSPYSVAKFASTKYLLYLNMAKGFPVTIMRATNTYGRVRDAHFFVERTIAQMLSKKEQVLLGDPKPIRDFMYVDDHVNGYLAVLNNREKAVGQIFNLATGHNGTTGEYAERIAKIVGYKGEIAWHSAPERPLDIMDHRLDASKAKRILGWEAKVDFDEGVRITAKALSKNS